MTTASAPLSSTAGTSAHTGAIERVLLAMEVVLVVGAISGGLGLIFGFMPVDDMTAQHLPLHSPALGGIALLLVNGVLPAIAIWGQMTGQRWADRGHLVVGAALVGWIIVQVGFIGANSWLQAVLFVWGVMILAFGLLNLRQVNHRQHPHARRSRG